MSDVSTNMIIAVLVIGIPWIRMTEVQNGLTAVEDTVFRIYLENYHSPPVVQGVNRNILTLTPSSWWTPWTPPSSPTSRTFCLKRDSTRLTSRGSIGYSGSSWWTGRSRTTRGSSTSCSGRSTISGRRAWYRSKSRRYSALRHSRLQKSSSVWQINT